MKHTFYFFILILIVCSSQLHSQSFVDTKNNSTGNTKSGNDTKNEVIFHENFDSEDFPPANWTDSVFNTEATWFRFDIKRNSFSQIDKTNKSSAVCPYHINSQNEWLISPSIDIANTKTLWLNFYAGYSAKWLDSTNITLYISNTSGEKWDSVWTAPKPTENKLWNWREASVDLWNYANDSLQRTDIMFGFQYSGKNGDLIALDDIKLIGGGLSKEANITTFILPNQKDTSVTSLIDTTKHTVNVSILSDPTLKILTPYIEISRGASINPNKTDTLAYEYNADSVVYVYTVTAADPNISQKWSVIVKMIAPNKQADIIDFIIKNQTNKATIDTIKNTVVAEVEYGSRIDSLQPTFVLSHGATYTMPTDSIFNFVFDKPHSIKIFPQDPYSEPQNYSITIKERNYKNDITAFKVRNEINKAHIDTTFHTVIDTVLYETNFAEVAATIETSPGSSFKLKNPNDNAFVSGKAKEYIVTAANGNEQTWKIYLIRNLFEVFTESFDDTTTIRKNKWTVEITDTSHTWQIGNQPRNPFNKVNQLSKYSLMCPHSRADQDEWAISRQIDSTQLKSLWLMFHVGINKNYVDSAGLYVYVIETKTKDTTEIWNTNRLNKSELENYWDWTKVELDLNKFMEKDIKIAFRYKGKNGDVIGIDDIKLADNSRIITNLNTTTNVKNEVAIYPNPCSDFIIIDTKHETDFILIDINGRVLINGNINNNTRIDTNNLKAGIYFIKLFYNNKQSTQKIIVH